MSSEELKTTVLALADADPSLSEEAKLLILGALDGDEMFAEVLRGESGPIERTAPVQSASAPEPVGAYLKSIAVSGFRGVGPEVRVPLAPGPGLVVIAGRNGCGKSAIAEALEMALTGESYRWLNRTAVWTESWRNLHDSASTAIRVEVAEEGAGITTIGLDWTRTAGLQECTKWIQRPGKKREVGFASLGWSAPIELYRPLLSYDELGGVLDKPSQLFDKLFSILGLERIADGLKRLNKAHKELLAPVALAKSLAADIKPLLSASEDSRAAAALALLAMRPPNVSKVQALVTGTDAASFELSDDLRRLARISLPQTEEITQAAVELRAAAVSLAEISGSAVEISAWHADLLQEALNLHRDHGDTRCPVCGVGELDAGWAERGRAALASQRAELVGLMSARALRDQTRKRALELVAGVGPLPTTRDPALTALGPAQHALDGWLAIPDDDVAVADHLSATFAGLSSALTAARDQATRLLSERENLWAPLALQLGEWATQAQQAQDQAPRSAEVKAAQEWLKRNAAQLRNHRLEPLAERARHIWGMLRQESNVDLGAIRLEGENTRRHVQLLAEVDGVPTGALGVMSQGELHALALALFLPRAAAPESPFRFIVLDDPIQAMDPAKVEGLLTVLEELAVDRQVIVLSHDDRLPAAIRRRGGNGRIYEMTRDTNSAISLKDAFHPSTRYIEDALTFALDDNVPVNAKDRVIPGLCRMALETTALEVYSARSYAAGMDRSIVDEQWADATTLRQRLALALHLDKTAPIDVWLKGGSRRSTAFRVCNSGVHSGAGGDHAEDVRAVRTAIKDLRSGGS